MGSQSVGGDGLSTGVRGGLVQGGLAQSGVTQGGLAHGGLAQGGVVTDTALSNSTVTRPAPKQRVQTQAKSGRHRVVARFDGRPRRPVRQSVDQSWLNAGCGSCSPGTIRAHQHAASADMQLAASADVDDSIADMKQLTTLQTSGDQSHSVLSVFHQSCN